MRKKIVNLIGSIVGGVALAAACIVDEIEQRRRAREEAKRRQT